MSRHQRRLKARLSDDRNSVLCGNCGKRLAAVRHGVLPLTFDDHDDPRMVAFDVRGWELGSDGLWQVPAESRGEFLLGRKPRVRDYDARFPRLPVRVECPVCSARQLLDPAILDVSANENQGYVRVRETLILKAVDNPAWCAAHGCPSDGHGKHDVGATC